MKSHQPKKIMVYQQIRSPLSQPMQVMYGIFNLGDQGKPYMDPMGIWAESRSEDQDTICSSHRFQVTVPRKRQADGCDCGWGCGFPGKLVHIHLTLYIA